MQNLVKKSSKLTIPSNNVLGLPLSELRENFDDDAAPLRDDLVDAAETILKIHFMYNLGASDVRTDLQNNSFPSTVFVLF